MRIIPLESMSERMESDLHILDRKLAPMFVPDESNGSLIQKRTVCCESYKIFGQRCAMCPNHCQTREAAEDRRDSFLARIQAPAPTTVLVHPASN